MLLSHPLFIKRNARFQPPSIEWTRSLSFAQKIAGEIDASKVMVGTIDAMHTEAIQTWLSQYPLPLEQVRVPTFISFMLYTVVALVSLRGILQSICRSSRISTSNGLYCITRRQSRGQSSAYVLLARAPSEISVGRRSPTYVDLLHAPKDLSERVDPSPLHSDVRNNRGEVIY